MSRIYLNDLIGLKLGRYQGMNESKDIAIFDTSKGKLLIECIGDCCSEGWIEHIELPDDLFNSEILEVEEIEGREYTEGDLEFSGKQEFDKTYFLKIKTTKGYIYRH